MTEIDTWLSTLALAAHVQLQHSYTRKRDEIKQTLYRGRTEECPDTQSLLGTAMPLPPALRKGKSMVKLIREVMHATFGRTVDVLQTTTFLNAARLDAIRANDGDLTADAIST